MAPGCQLDPIEQRVYLPNARSCDLKESGDDGTSWARRFHVATAPLSRISMRRKMIVLRDQLFTSKGLQNQQEGGTHAFGRRHVNASSTGTSSISNPAGR